MRMLDLYATVRRSDPKTPWNTTAVQRLPPNLSQGDAVSYTTSLRAHRGIALQSHCVVHQDGASGWCAFDPCFACTRGSWLYIDCGGVKGCRKIVLHEADLPPAAGALSQGRNEWLPPPLRGGDLDLRGSCRAGVASSSSVTWCSRPCLTHVPRSSSRSVHLRPKADGVSGRIYLHYDGLPTSRVLAGDQE